MDALALLCTLHADGPATLVRLRAADCATLEDVIAANADQLAVLLRSSLLSASRFQKEALQLQDRLAAPVETAAAVRNAGESRIRTARRHVEAALPEVPRETAPTAIERVLAAWRDADAAEESVTPDANPSAIPIAAIDGMDADTSRALAEAGVTDLTHLAGGDALRLSRQTGLSYSKLVRLRALARRQLPAARAVVTPPEPERFSPADAPPLEREAVLRLDREFVLEPHAEEEGVGGPFA